MKPTEILREEHNLIRQALDNFEMAVEKLENGEKPAKEFFEKAIEFARLFSDKFHHYKEEYLMFGRLAQKKNGALDAQIDALRYQHDRGRDLVAEISQSLPRYAQGQDPQATIIMEDLAAYISLLRHHIHREDHVFYPMVDKELSASDQKYLLDEFKKEAKKDGGNITSTSERLVSEMGALL
ncbi:MAG: hemerythrin domain-containing protein [Candidatus Lindowbacteria bacterium]|nr:hemerythrin domain-containing protein [Candidatus Lindowbacteria bacterium]